MHREVKHVNVVMDILSLNKDKYRRGHLKDHLLYSTILSKELSSSPTVSVSQEVFDFIESNSIVIDVGTESRFFLVGLSFVRLTIQKPFVLIPKNNIMSLTEIKKALDKQKPLATFLHALKYASGVYLIYGCCLNAEDALPNLFFHVPVLELGDGLFPSTIEAQLLIRYIVLPETTQP